MHLLHAGQSHDAFQCFIFIRCIGRFGDYQTQILASVRLYLHIMSHLKVFYMFYWWVLVGGIYGDFLVFFGWIFTEIINNKNNKTNLAHLDVTRTIAAQNKTSLRPLEFHHIHQIPRD